MSEQDITPTFVVEKTNEGVAFEEPQLPIDINYAKLADWLVDRKKIPADWRKRLATIQARVNKLLPDLPRGTHTDLLSLPSQTENHSVGYTECRRVRDLLASLRPEERSVFGGHSGITGSWDSVVRAYERGQVFLGEAAVVLVQNTNYDIPFLRREASKIQQQLSDIDRRESEHRRAAAASAQAFKSACNDLGIKGDNIRSEVQGLVRALVPLLESAAHILCSSSDIGAAVEYYSLFLTHIHRQEGATARVLPTLTSLRADPASVWKQQEAEEQPEGSSSTQQEEGGIPAMGAAQEDTAPTHSHGTAAPVTPGGLAAPTKEGAEGEAANRLAGTELDLGAAGQDWLASGPGTAGAPLAISWDVGPLPAGPETGGGGPLGQIQWDAGADDVADADAGPKAPVGIEWDVSPAADDAAQASRGGEGALVEIQWDVSVDGAGEAVSPGSAVDEGVGDAGALDLEGAEGLTPAGGIDWGIGIEESGAAQGDRQEEGVVQAEGDGSGSGGKEEADEGGQQAVRDARKALEGMLLVQTYFRNLLLDDLFELRAFLRQRAVEMVREEGSPLQTQLLAAAPEGPLQELSAASLKSLEGAVADATQCLISRRVTNLLLIHTSHRYVERLAEGLERKKGHETRVQGSMAQLERRRAELRSSLSANLLRQDEAVKRTRRVKALVEVTLSRDYKGRPVNIVGEINNQLGTT